MKSIRNKKVLSKILIVLLVIMGFNIISPMTVKAADLGGILMEPIANVLTSLGDGIMDIIHQCIMGQTHATLHSSSTFWGDVISVIVFAGVVITLSILTVGLGILPAMATGFVLLIGGGAGILAYNGLTSDRVSLPVYSISPEEIFMNKIPLLNVNFFNPEKYKSEYDKFFTEVTTIEDTTNQSILNLNLFMTKVEIKESYIKVSDVNYVYYDVYHFDYNGKKYEIHQIPDRGVRSFL